MRLNWNIPLPGPFSLGGNATGLLSGCWTLFVVLPLWLSMVMLLAGVWALWWSVKVWWLAFAWLRSRITGTPLPAQRGWW